MSEPLDEDVEISWHEYLNRFDNEIFPALFLSHGYTRDAAAMVWSLGKLENSIAVLIEKLEELT